MAPINMADRDPRKGKIPVEERAEMSTPDLSSLT
jgi:hypothetical protein